MHDPELAAPHLPLRQSHPELGGILAALREGPTLLEFALGHWLLRRITFANEEAPELQSETIPGQLRWGHPEPVGD
eukprot:15432795-Alexandrium_andersonii.AAC.1